MTTDKLHQPRKDASPSTERDWSQEPSDGGSAWERIRRRAGLPALSKNQRREWWQQQLEGSGRMSGDDFTFPSSEQERNYAQEEAQRVFDARGKGTAARRFQGGKWLGRKTIGVRFEPSSSSSPNKGERHIIGAQFQICRALRYHHYVSSTS